MQTKTKMLTIRIAGWVFLCGGIAGIYFSLGAWFMVPGEVDLNRLIVAGLFASLATNALLLSGLLFSDSADGDARILRLVLRTPPVIISGLFLITFVLVSTTAAWWASH